MAEGKRGLRFLFAGGVNTAVTYLMYLGLLHFTSAQISYAISFLSGIAISYVLNRVFVFKAHQGYRSAVMLVLVYLLQYLTGAVVVWGWVDLLKFPPALAPAISIIITLPVTYFLSKFAFIGKLR